MNFPDTNQINQLAQTAQDVKTQLSPWLPALTVAAAWLGREFNRFIVWSQIAADKIIAHGGIIKIIGKLFYNPNG
jgi:hypothetical protein